MYTKKEAEIAKRIYLDYLAPTIRRSRRDRWYLNYIDENTTTVEDEGKCNDEKDFTKEELDAGLEW